MLCGGMYLCKIKEIDVQTVLYRMERNQTEVLANGSRTGMPIEISERKTLVPLSPELFYPVVSDEEYAMWEHWLPSSLVLNSTTHYAIRKELARLQAPEDVMTEYEWSQSMQLFEQYELRSPVRKDARDPLLLGKSEDGKRHRIALWGESLRPLTEIARLVQESLAVKARAEKRRLVIGLSGTTPSAALAFYSFYLIFHGQAFGIVGLLLAYIVSGCSWVPSLVHSPLNAQHDFLDRYRR